MTFVGKKLQVKSQFIAQFISTINYHTHVLTTGHTARRNVGTARMTREMSRHHRHHSLHHPRRHHGHDSKNNTHNKSSSSLLIEKAFFFHILVFCSMFEATVTGSVGADTGLEVGGAVSKRDPRSRGRTSAPATVGTTTAAATPAPYPTSTMNENYRNGAGGCKDNAPTSVCSTVSPEECVGQGWGVQVSPCPPARPPARTQTAHIICIFFYFIFQKKD